MRTSLVLGALAAALVLVGCGSEESDGRVADSSAPPATSVPGPSEDSMIDGVMGGELIGCRNGPFFPAAALASVVSLAEADRPAIERAIAPFLTGEEGTFWPQMEQWSILHSTPDRVLLVATDPTGDEVQVGFMTVELSDGEWRWAGSSLGESCPLHRPAPDGLGDVEWRVDPDAAPLNPDSTQIHILAHERACASGRSMEDRVIGPDVRETDQAVMISFAVEPLEGDQECPSNPELPFTIELERPLGERELLDSRDLGVTIEDLLAR